MLCGWPLIRDSSSGGWLSTIESEAKEGVVLAVFRLAQSLLAQHPAQLDDFSALGHDDLPRQPAHCGIAALIEGVVGHLQGTAVVGDHPLKKPHHPVGFGGGGAHHLHRLDLGSAHALQTCHGVGISAGFKGHGIYRRLWIPGLAPLAHGLDLAGLLAPDAVGQSAHAGGADVEHEFTHPQRAGVVLHHRVEPAQVVGGACRADVMAVAVGSGSRGGLMVIVVLMVLVGIALGQGRGGPDDRQQERCSGQKHWE